MCGIAGIFAGAQAQPPEFPVLRRMAGSLQHRGPDGAGYYRDDSVGLAHTRLSIVDLAGGAQPMSNAGESIWVCFNGEIFNHSELREELRAAGQVFATSSDTEVIIQAYAEWGERAWTKFNGQFAFALWDVRRQTFWLVRDRLGILPLFYAETASGIVFASEIKAIHASGLVERGFDPAGLVEAFVRWSPAPPQTVFENVRQAPAGCALKISMDRTIEQRHYWNAMQALESPWEGSEAEACDALEALLSDSIALRLRADVPVGAYVSGGLDSSVIGVLARERLGDAPLDTFGIGFEEERYDERPEQHAMAAHIQSRHHEVVCTGADIRDNLEDVVWHCEAPLLRTSPSPMFHLSRKVREAGVKTVLTGEGADELFAGYTLFKEDSIRRFWAKRPDSSMRPALLSRIHHYVGSAEARSNGLWRDFFGYRLSETDHPHYAHLVRWRNNAWALRLLAPEIRNAISPEALEEALVRRTPQDWMAYAPLQRAQIAEIETFMSPYLLASQADRVAMANGVEARYPFLDLNVVNFALSLPAGLKLRGLSDKIVLRRLAARKLPLALAARKKQPFRAPIASALLSAESLDHTAGMLAESTLIDRKAAGLFLDRVRRRDGQGLGEREEMGTVGLITLSMLARRFGQDFNASVERGVEAQELNAPSVMVDRSTQAVVSNKTTFVGSL